MRSKLDSKTYAVLARLVKEAGGDPAGMAVSTVLICDHCQDPTKEAFPYFVYSRDRRYFQDLCNDCFEALDCQIQWATLDEVVAYLLLRRNERFHVLTWLKNGLVSVNGQDQTEEFFPVFNGDVVAIPREEVSITQNWLDFISEINDSLDKESSNE